METGRRYLLGEVARLLDVQPYRIVYLLSSRQIDEPPRLGNRRMFDCDDIQKIAEKLGVEEVKHD